MPVVKRTISIPEDVFAAAEAAGSRLGLSRSELYARAVRRYVTELDADMVTRRLNDVYGTEDSGLDPLLAEAQTASLDKDELLDDWTDDDRSDHGRGNRP